MTPRRCVRLCAQVLRGEMVPTFIALLQDGEAEVRIAAASKATQFAARLPAEAIQVHPPPRLTPRADHATALRACPLPFPTDEPAHSPLTSRRGTVCNRSLRCS